MEHPSKSATPAPDEANQTPYDWATSIYNLSLTSAPDIGTLARAASLDPEAGDLSAVDLSGLDLTGQDFSGWDLEFAEFNGADIKDADFSKAKLSASSFVHSKNWQNAKFDEGFKFLIETEINKDNRIDVIYYHEVNKSVNSKNKEVITKNIEIYIRKIINHLIKTNSKRLFSRNDIIFAAMQIIGIENRVKNLDVRRKEADTLLFDFASQKNEYKDDFTSNEEVVAPNEEEKKIIANFSKNFRLAKVSPETISNVSVFMRKINRRLEKIEGKIDAGLHRQIETLIEGEDFDEKIKFLCDSERLALLEFLKNK